MWREDDGRHSKLAYSFAVSACLNFFLILLILWGVGGFKTILTGNEVVASIVTNEEDEEFIRKVCEDLGLESEVTMVVGPYYVHSFFSPAQNHRLRRLLSKYPILVDPEDPTRRILMRESIYSELATEERQAVLAHELWHIRSFIKDGQIALVSLNREIEANRFAVRYVGPDILINLYRRYGGDYPGIKALINDLEKQKLVAYDWGRPIFLSPNSRR